MKLDIIAYNDIATLESNRVLADKIDTILRAKGIIGISGVPGFVARSQAYMKAAREFAALETSVKEQYTPKRDEGLTEGYELGAEWFKNATGEWQIDDKKASYYAWVPDKPVNVWPTEVDLQTAYQALGQLMLDTGSLLLGALGISDVLGLKREQWQGYGRYLHYQKAGNETEANSEWCGAHFDHCALTALMPAHYFRNGVEIDEPSEAGLHILPSGESDYVKIEASDKSLLLFQIGEFSQVASNDRIKATKHLVKKAHGDIERFAFALFFDAPYEATVKSTSTLAANPRYMSSQSEDGFVTYGDWSKATYALFRAK
jgi:isopenicillin N synthase-like dioxygenase